MDNLHYVHRWILGEFPWIFMINFDIHFLDIFLDIFVIFLNIF